MDDSKEALLWLLEAIEREDNPVFKMRLAKVLAHLIELEEALLHAI
jgi:hypothetical protein